MKKIYKIPAVVIVMLIAVAGMSAHAAPAASHPDYTLYPPTNFNTISMELCFVYMTWDKPHDPGGLTPAGLLGYKIYRDGSLVHYLSDPDSLFYFDFIEDVGAFTDSVTAYYDLTTYGSPGQFGESIAVSAVSVIECGQIIPFSEPWDLASFSYQMWSFEPSQGNWAMSTTQGNPTPTAKFTGTPVLTNYSYRLRTMQLLGGLWTCSNVYLDFDYRLIVNHPTSMEKIIIEVRTNGVWNPIDSLVNDVSTGWVHKHINIVEFIGTSFGIGFRAVGQNSADIGKWDIDNIKVYPVCYTPPDYALQRTGNDVHLSWGTPCTGKKISPNGTTGSILVGYDLYRTDTTGLPPFVQLNQQHITANAYDDILPLQNGSYCYYIAAVYKDSINPTYILCEGISDTLCVQYASGINDQNLQGINIYPNPVTDMLHIRSDQAVSSVEILDFVGVSIYSMTGLDLRTISIPIKDQPAGIYFIKIRIGDRFMVRKVVKQ